MSLEKSYINLSGSSQEYRPYIRERNAAVAQAVSKIAGLEFDGEIDDLSSERNVIPAVTALKTKVLDSQFSLYGLLIDRENHVHKTILHTIATGFKQRSQSEEVCKGVEGRFVLPGYSAYDAEQAQRAFNLLLQEHGRVRLKAANESDGNGQISFETQDMFNNYITHGIGREGVVLEPDLYHPATYSVGFCVLNNIQYSFVAQEKKATRSNGTDEYRGADATVCAGPIEELRKFAQNTQQNEAIELASGFHNVYSHVDPIASRLSFDVIMGEDFRGNYQSGVVDITGRIGGTCPAIMEAIPHLMSGARSVRSEVNLNYADSPDVAPAPQSYEDSAATYLDHDESRNVTGLRISARVTNIDNSQL